MALNERTPFCGLKGIFHTNNDRTPGHRLIERPIATKNGSFFSSRTVPCLSQGPIRVWFSFPIEICEIYNEPLTKHSLGDQITTECHCAMGRNPQLCVGGLEQQYNFSGTKVSLTKVHFVIEFGLKNLD